MMELSSFLLNRETGLTSKTNLKPAVHAVEGDEADNCTVAVVEVVEVAVVPSPTAMCQR